MIHRMKGIMQCVNFVIYILSLFNILRAAQSLILSCGLNIDWKFRRAWWTEAFIERMEWKRLLLNGTRSLHHEPLFRPHPFRPYPNPWWGLLSLFPGSNRNIHRLLIEILNGKLDTGCTVCPTRYRLYHIGTTLIPRKTKVDMIRLKIVFEQLHTFGSGFISWW